MSEAAASAEIPVVVVVPPRVLLLDIAGPVEVLRMANLHQAALRFAVTYVGPSAEIGSSVGLGLAGISPLPERLADDTIVVIAGSADAPMGAPGHRAAEDNSEAAIVAWLVRAVRPGIRLVSICSGALLAARAGLLDGHACTTHAACLPDLARLAPAARVLENRLFVEDRERLTSAGITAGIDLMLHVVAGACGPGVALSVARALVVYLRRSGSDPQLSPWLEGRNHIHPAVHRAQDAVAADPARDWSVAELARVASTSPRNLSRLFNEQAGTSVTDYVNGLRIALARELIAGSRLDMEHVAERSGFASPASSAAPGTASTTAHPAAQGCRSIAPPPPGAPMDGKPVSKTRVPVRSVASMPAKGVSFAEVADGDPSLTPRMIALATIWSAAPSARSRPRKLADDRLEVKASRRVPLDEGACETV